eukprot:scaffold81095_cov35-Tisochrysis_lutea.AAC.2
MRVDLLVFASCRALRAIRSSKRHDAEITLGITTMRSAPAPRTWPRAQHTQTSHQRVAPMPTCTSTKCAPIRAQGERRTEDLRFEGSNVPPQAPVEQLVVYKEYTGSPLSIMLIACAQEANSNGSCWGHGRMRELP